MKSIYILTALQILLLQVEANTFTNPIALRAPDPWMQYYEGYYYLAATTFDTRIKMRKSKTLEGIHSAPEVTVFTLVDTHNMWAPEFHLLNGTAGNRWYLYYVAGTGDVHTARIHVLESAGIDPMGPYHFKADLTDPHDDGFDLDPSVIRINGKLYLLGSYKRQGSQDLFIRPMSEPWLPSGPKVKLSSPTNSWEKIHGLINEGPEPLQHNGKSFIVFSANSCSTADYQLGLLTLTGTDPLNPSHWHKSGPVFQRNDSEHVYGPGHNGFFLSPDGKENWIVYHANELLTGRCDGNRSSRAQKFTWHSDETPNFGTPIRFGVKLQSPSGE